MKAVRIDNISFNYGTVAALKDISLTVERGEMLGLIGADGAGKTSLFRILATLLLPHTGEAYIDGLNVVKDYKAVRQRIGYMPGRFALYQDLSIEENLNLYATVFGTTVESNMSLIRDIYRQIEPFRTRRAGKLSGGMKQKLALCCALIHKPSLLLLDEPTTGVDAVSRQEFSEILLRLREQGITILISTPYMDEAARCDRLALISHGELLTVGTPKSITAAYPHKLYAVPHSQKETLHTAINTAKHHSAYIFGRELHIATAHPEPEWEEITPNIEDCFIELINASGNSKDNERNTN